MTLETALACAKLGVRHLTVRYSAVREEPDKVPALYRVTPKQKANMIGRAALLKITLCDYASFELSARARRATLTARDFEGIARTMRAKSSREGGALMTMARLGILHGEA